MRISCRLYRLLLFTYRAWDISSDPANTAIISLKLFSVTACVCPLAAAFVLLLLLRLLGHCRDVLSDSVCVSGSVLAPVTLVVDGYFALSAVHCPLSGVLFGLLYVISLTFFQSCALAIIQHTSTADTFLGLSHEPDTFGCLLLIFAYWRYKLMASLTIATVVLNGILSAITRIPFAVNLLWSRLLPTLNSSSQLPCHCSFVSPLI